MDAKCNRLMQSESREVVNARKASFYICLGPMPAGGIKRCTVYRNHAGETAFSCDARFLQNTTKGIHSGYLVSKSVHPKMYWLQNGSFVDRCGARKFHSLHLHFEISFFSLCILKFFSSLSAF